MHYIKKLVTCALSAHMATGLTVVPRTRTMKGGSWSSSAVYLIVGSVLIGQHSCWAGVPAGRLQLAVQQQRVRVHRQDTGNERFKGSFVTQQHSCCLCDKVIEVKSDDTSFY
jgi:hypothetical protein